MAQVVASRNPASASSTAKSVVLKGRDFNNPALNQSADAQLLQSGRYLLPQRKIPSKLKQPRFERSKSAVYLDPGPCAVRYKEIIESRPPLRPDLSTPGPWAYNTHHTKPLNETNAPSFTMRPRCWPEKDRTNGRTAWSKTWYQSPEVWTTKANFQSDNKWPNPQSYHDKRSLGGEHNPSFTRYPAYTMGHKAKKSFDRQGPDKEPSPCSYSKDKADSLIYNRSPTIIHSFRPKNANLWTTGSTPGPGAYSPNINSVAKHQPAFSLGTSSREGLEPLLGPYASTLI